jgi:hypothetical protein
MFYCTGLFAENWIMFDAETFLRKVTEQKLRNYQDGDRSGASLLKLFYTLEWCHDIQHNDIRYNDI